MSNWDERPPPLPPRTSRPGAVGSGQYSYSYSPQPAEPAPPPMPPRPRSGLDETPNVLGSFRESWRQIRSSLGAESRQSSYGLRPPALPPRPVSPSAAPPPAPSPRPLNHGSYASQTTSPHLGSGYVSPASRPAVEETQTAPSIPPKTAANPPGNDTRQDGPLADGDGTVQDIYKLLQGLAVSSEYRTGQPSGSGHGSDYRESPNQAPPEQPASDSKPPPQEQPHASSPQQSEEPRAGVKEKKPVTPETACVSIASTFPATWYYHPDAPEVSICSRCYDQHLRKSRFGAQFDGRHFADGKPRMCKFDTSSVRERLLKDAGATGSIGQLMEHMRTRATVPDCKGTGGVRGSEGTDLKWFNIADGSIPGFIICEACWLDHASAFAFASKMQPYTNVQGENDVWACDLAVPYIRRQFEERSKAGDWRGFVTEATARLRVAPCPKMGRAPRRGRKWFCPRKYPAILACAACYCDQVLGLGQEAEWRDSDEDPSVKYADDCVCALGHFSISVAMSFAQDRKGYSLFWNAIDASMRGPSCEPEGIKGATWYTLESDPLDFGVCGACHVSVLQSMDLAKFFVPKRNVPPDAVVRCSLNPSFPRFPAYLSKLLEAYYTQDTSALSSFAAEYAHLPLCSREKTLQNARWYGWPDCAICPACHHDVSRSTALEPSMPWRGQPQPAHTMCALYSPRMRALYAESCASSPPDASALLAFGAHRIRVYMQTVMVIEQIMVQQQMDLARQKSLNAQSLFYTSLGNTEAVMLGSTHTWGAPGVGYGFENQHQLQGAMYGKQALEIAQTGASGAATFRVAELERQWRAVE